MLYLNYRRTQATSPAVPAYLTLTSVVFESKHQQKNTVAMNDLTLTSVVFEYCFKNSFLLLSAYLTLTSVVFELVKSNTDRKNLIFNFNKCCIWIKNFNKNQEFKIKFNFNKCCIWI